MFLCCFTPDHISALLVSRCPGQQGQEEGHLGSEAEQPSLCPRPGQVFPGEEQQRWPASRTDRPHLAEQRAVGGHPHTDWHCTHKVKTDDIIFFWEITFPLYPLNWWWWNAHFLKKSRDNFLDLCPTYCQNDKVIKLCKNSFTLFFSPSGDLARDPLLRSWSKETSFTVSIKSLLPFHLFISPPLMNLIMPSLNKRDSVLSLLLLNLFGLFIYLFFCWYFFFFFAAFHLKCDWFEFSCLCK